jgi:uncharacterized protein
VEVLARARSLLDAYDEELRRDLPEGIELFDAHTHLGNDIDGMQGRPEELLGLFDRYGFSAGFVFCLDEPDREPAFRAANDRTLAHAHEAGSRLVPFVRLDLAGPDPMAEAERCLDVGARGIKLHPRAQKFMLTDELLAPVFALAEARNVPILIHGGRGLPPIADDLARLVERYPDGQLIIAHAGIADMAGLAGHLGGKAGVFFDTSVWSPLDLLDLYRLVAPEQVVYASDYPYGSQPSSLLLTLRTAKLCGYSDEQLRALFAGNARRILAGEAALEPTRPVGDDSFAQPLTFARIHQYLSMATPMLWTRQPDTIGVLGLALNATEERNGYRAETEQIRELLLAARDLWRAIPELDDDADVIQIGRAAFRLIHVADILAVTAGT